MKKFLLLTVALIFLTSCAKKYVVLGKRCFDKTTGMHSWSYVWVADQEVMDKKLLKKCK